MQTMQDRNGITWLYGWNFTTEQNISEKRIESFVKNGAKWKIQLTKGWDRDFFAFFSSLISFAPFFCSEIERFLNLAHSKSFFNSLLCLLFSLSIRTPPTFVNHRSTTLLLMPLLLFSLFAHFSISLYRFLFACLFSLIGIPQLKYVSVVLHFAVAVASPGKRFRTTIPNSLVHCE